MPDELIVSEMCEAYHCTPRQWREEFTLWEQRVFWHIQQMKRAKQAQDRADAETRAAGRTAVRHG